MKFSGQVNDEIKAFNNLLSAMYGKRYSLDPSCALSQLQLLTQLADYYCSLPAVSQSLTQILIDKDYYIDDHPEGWIAVAYKLRHAALFRECVVYLAGDWGSGIKSTLEAELDLKIKNTVTLARTQISTKIAEVHANILFQSRDNKRLKDAVLKITETSSEFLLPGFYRELGAYDCLGHENARNLIQSLISTLVDNNLRFFGLNLYPGAALYTNYFLCATVSDEELPWDIHQEDY